ncbi:MAG: hypothetical protein ACREML_07665, partial [Vulcanimicrobiaceae bacterium]
MSVRIVAIFAPFVLGIALSGCGGGGNALPYQSQNTPSASETLNVLPGGNSAAIVPLDGFTGTIAFPQNNAPAGTQATLTS